MAGVIRGRSPLILAVKDARQLCCGVVHLQFIGIVLFGVCKTLRDHAIVEGTVDVFCENLEEAVGYIRALTR